MQQRRRGARRRRQADSGQLAEARNQAETHVLAVGKAAQGARGQAQARPTRKPSKQAIDKTREAAKGNDVSAIKSAVRELEQASHA